jgi:hypothetical protein
MEMNALIRTEVLLLLLAAALFAVAALHSSGDFDAIQVAQDFFGVS